MDKYEQAEKLVETLERFVAAKIDDATPDDLYSSIELRDARDELLKTIIGISIKNSHE